VKEHDTVSKTQTSNFAVVQDSAGGRQASLVPATL